MTTSRQRIQRPTFRFAPSPNGELHLGHALSALTGFAAAKRAGGRFLLRIEDIDPGRSRPEFADQIFEDLRWLGLSWEEPVMRQSERMSEYRRAADQLARMGVLYPCFATRSDIAAAVTASGATEKDPDGAPLYPGFHRDAPPEMIGERIARGEPFARRIDMARALDLVSQKPGGQRGLQFTELDSSGRQSTVVARPERWGDAVITRKDTPTSYHLAVVVDDAAQGVTHVTRGRDLLAATDLHRLLQVLLDLPEPVYQHHELITDDSGRKLSKSAKDTSLRRLRADGASAEDIRARLGFPAWDF